MFLGNKAAKTDVYSGPGEKYKITDKFEDYYPVYPKLKEGEWAYIEYIQDYEKNKSFPNYAIYEVPRVNGYIERSYGYVKCSVLSNSDNLTEFTPKSTIKYAELGRITYAKSESQRHYVLTEKTARRYDDSYEVQIETLGKNINGYELVEYKLINENKYLRA